MTSVSIILFCSQALNTNGMKVGSCAHQERIPSSLLVKVKLNVTHGFFEKEGTCFSAFEFSLALTPSGHGADHWSYPVCVPTIIACRLPFRQTLTPLCQSESCYELHHFSADNRPWFLLPALRFLLYAEFPGHQQKTVSLCIPQLLRLWQSFYFPFWGRWSWHSHCIKLLYAGSPMLVCYLRIMGRHSLLCYYFPVYSQCL